MKGEKNIKKKQLKNVVRKIAFAFLRAATLNKEAVDINLNLVEFGWKIVCKTLTPNTTLCESLDNHVLSCIKLSRYNLYTIYQMN
jgi:hypothetical protein